MEMRELACALPCWIHWERTARDDPMKKRDRQTKSRRGGERIIGRIKRKQKRGRDRQAKVREKGHPLFRAYYGF